MLSSPSSSVGGMPSSPAWASLSSDLELSLAEVANDASLRYGGQDLTDDFATRHEPSPTASRMGRRPGWARSPSPSHSHALSGDFTHMTRLDYSAAAAASPARAAISAAATSDYSFTDATADDGDSWADPSASGLGSLVDLTDPSFQRPARGVPALESQRRPAPTAAAAASERRSAFFQNDLASRAERIRADKARTPLSPIEVENKQYRIAQIERRIAALRSNHAAKKARVAESLTKVQEAAMRFRARNNQVAAQGLTVVQALEEAQLRMQQEDVEQAQEDAESPLAARDQRVTKGLRGLPPSVLGPNPQTTIRSMYSTELPAALMVKQPGATGPRSPTPVFTGVEVDGQCVQPLAPTRASALSDEPLPPQPALVEQLAARAVHAMELGEKVDRKAYALLMSATAFEAKRLERRTKQQAQQRGEFGVPSDATAQQHKEWVDHHVFNQTPRSAHAHSFPAPHVAAPEVPVASGSASRALELEKKRFTSYVRVTRDAWAGQAVDAQVNAIGRLEESMASMNVERSKARIRFEQEKAVSLALLTKQRALLELKDVQATEAAARSEYRRRAENVFHLLQTDGVWRSDQGAQALDMLQRVGRQATLNTYWTQPPPVAPAPVSAHSTVDFVDPSFDVDAYLRVHPTAPSQLDRHRAQQAAAAYALHQAEARKIGWTEDLWEHKEWSHRSMSSTDEVPSSQPSTQPSQASTQRGFEKDVLNALEGTTNSHAVREALGHSSDLVEAESIDFERDSAEDHEPPSPETMRRARRRLQAAERDAKAAAALEADRRRVDEERRAKRARDARADREWEEARAARLRAEAQHAHEEAAAATAGRGTTPRTNRSVSFDSGPTSVQRVYDEKQRQLEQQARLAQDSRQPHDDDEPVEMPRSPSPHFPPFSISGAHDADEDTVNDLSQSRSHLFTASANRATLADHPLDGPYLHHARHNQYDPESDHKHVDLHASSSSFNSTRRNSADCEFGQNLLASSKQPTSLPLEHSGTRVSMYDQYLAPPTLHAHLPSPASHDYPPPPSRANAHSNPPPSRADYAHDYPPPPSRANAHTNPPPNRADAHDHPPPPSRTSAHGPAPIPTHGRDLSLINERPEQESPVQPQSFRHQGSVEIEDEVPGQSPSFTPTPDYPLRTGTSGQEVAASASQEPIFSLSSGLQPPQASPSPRSLPVSKPISSNPRSPSQHASSTDDTPPAPAGVDSVSTTRPRTRARPAVVVSDDLADDEFNELFASIDDYGEVSSSERDPLDSARDEMERRRIARERDDVPAPLELSPAHAAAAQQMQVPSHHHARVSSGTGGVRGGLSSMRSSGTDWDASNEGGDLEAFYTSEIGTNFYDHTSATRPRH